MLNKSLIEENIRRHDQEAANYQALRSEIYNPTEQSRLSSELKRAFEAVTSPSPRLLDFGSGAGNLTDKMLDFGGEVWAADVSTGMLGVIAQKYPQHLAAGTLRTVPLSGEFPLPFPDRHFSFIATYSVLHHVPDYLEAVRELIRVLDTGGVLYIDHETNANYWRSPAALRLHRGLLAPGYGLKRMLVHIKSSLGFREPPLPPRDERPILEEGDIHVYADDFIDWNEIHAIAQEKGLTPLSTDDYLLCRENSTFPWRYWLCNSFTDDMGIYVGCKNSCDES